MDDDTTSLRGQARERHAFAALAVVDGL